MTNIHAHIDSFSRDCDGPHEHGYTMTPNDSELVSEFGDIEFHHRVVNSVVNTYSIMEGVDATLTVQNQGDGVRLIWHEPTDEGFISIEANICHDDCLDVDEVYVRDYFAEDMGY